MKSNAPVSQKPNNKGCSEVAAIAEISSMPLVVNRVRFRISTNEQVQALPLNQILLSSSSHGSPIIPTLRGPDESGVL